MAEDDDTDVESEGEDSALQPYALQGAGYVTDPALLAQLNAPAVQPSTPAKSQYVTDPALLAQLNAPAVQPSTPAKSQYVTDPALLAQLNAPASQAPQAPAKGQYVTDPALLAQLNGAAPEAEGVLGTMARKFAHSVLPTLGGAAAGAWSGAAGGSWLGPWGAIGGGLIGGAAGGYAAATAQEAGLKALGYDDSHQQAVNAEANPIASAMGEYATLPLAFGRGAMGIAGRAASAAITGGLEAGTEYAHGEPISPARVVTSAAMGAAFPQQRGYLAPIEQRGAALGARLREQYGSPWQPGEAAPVTPSPHGSPGATAAAGTAEAKPAPTEAGGAPQPVNTNNYGKAEPRPASAEEAAGGVNLGSDPTIETALRAKMQPEGGAEPPARTIAAEQQPGEVLRGPEPAAAAPEPARAPPPPEATAQRAPGGAAEPEGTPRPLGAAPSPPPSAPPGAPPAPSLMGRLSDSLRTAASKITDIGSDLQMKVAPLARGTKESMVAAKDWADAKRRISYEWGERDRQITKQFTPEQRKRVWDAMDEESVMRQRGEKSEHMGIATLTPEEHALAETTQEWARDTWGRMRDVGMVEGEGLPYWTPRKLINAATSAAEEGGRSINRIGSNLSTTAPSLKRRKYLEAEQTEEAARARFGEQAEIARDIRALPLALAEMEHAIAGRQMMNAIREAGKRTGQETVAVGAKPTDSEHTWFTVDHPAFYTWRPKLEEADTAAYRAAVEQTGGIKVPPAKIPLMDRNGEPVFEKVPLYVRGDFEGPLRATLSEPSGLAYKTAMDLKGKTMGLIMNSPLIHNAVEWGRALAAMPGKVLTFKVYFDGYKARQPPPGMVGASPTMVEAVNGGMAPIGPRGFHQDIHAIMEEPNMAPGRSWTAKVTAAIPGLFDKNAGDAVKRWVDKAGDFWHNTLLWDRVADLQAGLYVNFRDKYIANGHDPQVAIRMAAHEANRFAGALPQEAMSNEARKFANLVLFSRSFTLGNLGVMKDMLNGMPRATLAQIERDIGATPEQLGHIKSEARRRAISVVMLDMGLMYAGNSLLQSGLNVMKGDKTLDDEARGYADRLHGMMKNVGENPMSLLQPLKLAEKLSSTSENEPGKHDRILIGHAKDGTAIYMRNPIGKIGEEFAGWASGPLDMIRRKLGTVARPAWQVLSNDKGFGRKVYDPNADTLGGYVKNMGRIVAHFLTAQGPEGQIGAAADLATGQGDPKVAAAQALGPIAGVTFSRGAPGGPAAGELYKAREEHQFKVNEALPDIRRMIQGGDEQGARQRMRELGIAPGLQNFYVRTTKNPQLRLSPRAVRDFNQYAPPEVRARFQRDLERQRQQQGEP